MTLKIDTIIIMKIAILLFDNFTALDIVGPYEVLNKLPDSQIYLVGPEKKEYKDSYCKWLLFLTVCKYRNQF